MAFRIGWLTPFTPTSGVGTFSQAVTNAFPTSLDGESIDVTILYPPHRSLYSSRHRSIAIVDDESFRQILSLFDLLVYNVGNNREHHEAIFDLLRSHPGVVVCHDYVYQHYLADRSLRAGQGFANYAALLSKYAGATADTCLRRSRITSRKGRVRYTPWDTHHSVRQPLSEPLLNLGSALVVHSAYMENYVRRTFQGPVLRLGMPCGQKQATRSASQMAELDRAWQSRLADKQTIHLVTFGYIQQAKCIDLFLCAVARSDVLRNSVRITVAGYASEGGCLGELRALAESLSLGDIVSFETDVSATRLEHIMAEADVFINLRRPNTEGSSASLIEQLDAGRPVVVLRSGCYAEIPGGAAVLLPPDASSQDLQRELEALLGDRERMRQTAEAGRAYARTWDCASYAGELVRFALASRRSLAWRGKMLGTDRRAQPVGEHAVGWVGQLARARLSLRYLDCHSLVVDPDILLRIPHEELCRYIAHVVFGIFDDARLYRDLDRYLTGPTRTATYWACVVLSLVADAVFAGDLSAQRRLAILGAKNDLNFWRVVENLPARQFLAVATLMLLGRMPEPIELDACENDDEDGYPKRLRLATVLDRSALSKEAGRIGQWLDGPSVPALDRERPLLDRDADWPVCDEDFGESVDLSGFHRLEPDHVWARGTQSFVGLRLGSAVVKVEALVRHVDASPSLPCNIGLSIGNLTMKVEARSTQPIWLGLELSPPNPTTPSTTTWCRLSAERASQPTGSEDTRLLGIALIRLRVSVRKAQLIAQVSSDSIGVAVQTAA